MDAPFFLNGTGQDRSGEYDEKTKGGVGRVNRLTRKQGNGSGYQVDSQQIQPLEEGYGGEAVGKTGETGKPLGRPEQKQKEISQKLEQLWGEGRTKAPSSGN